MNKKIVITESQFKRLRNLIKEEILLEDKLFNQISAIFRNVEIKSENDAKALLSKPESKPLFTYIENAVNNSLNARVPKQKGEYIKTLKNRLKSIFKMQQKPDDEVLTILADVLNGYAKIKNVNSFENIVEMLKQANTSGDQTTKAKSIDDLLNRPMGPSNQQKQEPNDKAAGADGTDEPKTEVNQMIYLFVQVLNELKESDILTIKLPRMDTMKLKCIDNKSKYSVFFTLADNEDTATEKIELPKIPEKYKFNEDSPVPNFDVMSIEYINDEGVITKKKEIIQGVYEWDIDEGDRNEEPTEELSTDEIENDIDDPNVSLEDFMDDIMSNESNETKSNALDIYRLIKKDKDFMVVQGGENPSWLKLLFANLTGKKIEPREGNIPVLNSLNKFFDDRITKKLGENFIENKTVFFKPLETIELPYVELKYDFTDRTRKPVSNVFELKANSEYTFRDAVKVKQFSIDSLKYGEYRILENAYKKFRIIVKEKSTQPHTFNCDVFKYYTDAANNQKVSKKLNVLIEFLNSDGYKTNKLNIN
jgi:hypothetical protein